MSAYGTNQAFKEYHTTRANDVTGIVESKITAALLVASEWLDNKYRSLYPGYKVGQREQIRDWPRYSAYDVYEDIIDSDTVPAEIELSLIHI